MKLDNMRTSGWVLAEALCNKFAKEHEIIAKSSH